MDKFGMRHGVILNEIRRLAPQKNQGDLVGNGLYVRGLSAEWVTVEGAGNVG
jgi:hypothetical protein